MKKIRKIVALLASVIMIHAIWQPMTLQAGEASYTSLTFDKDENLVRTVDGYLPKALWDKIGEYGLSKPSDLFITDEDIIYIADTGNKRILICDSAGNFLGEVTEGLNSPAGVFVTEEGKLYVADKGAKAVLVYEADGPFEKSFETPASPLFGKTAKYAPTKVIVNDAGTVYALSEGNGNGILTISDYGDFYGYFGANDTNVTLMNRIRRLFFSEGQMASLQKNVPAAAVNLDIDSTGLIYTVTQGENGKQGLKKYNIAGNNMFDKVYADNMVTDVAVGDIDNIFTISKNGFIYEYTRDGRLLFYFSGKDDGSKRIGLFVNAVAIDVDSQGNLYVLDQDRGDITVFETTEYARTVHAALDLYQNGLYLESREPWEKVLGKNSLFDFAYRGIAESLYKLEDYEGAMESARKGGAKSTYSDAFWQVRNQWLRLNIVTVFWIVAAFLILRKIWKKYGDRIIGIRRVKEIFRKLGAGRNVREFKYLGRVLKNPADAFYGIKQEGKVSVFTATLIYLLIFLIYVVNKYCCGFLFKSVADGYYDLVQDIVLVLGLMLLFVMCNNMVCAIRDGEATFRQNYCCFAYCFMPYLFLKPVAFLLSHVLTYNESFLISMLNFVMAAGSIILITVMIREIQCYTYKETFVSIFLTLFTMLVIVAAGIIIFALIRQVVDFLVAIFKEGYYRGW